MELSPYILCALKGEDKERYVQKCHKIGSVDPYSIPRYKFKDAASLKENELPNLDYGNIYSYLINFKMYTNKTLQLTWQGLATKSSQTGQERGRPKSPRQILQSGYTGSTTITC